MRHPKVITVLAPVVVLLAGYVPAAARPPGEESTDAPATIQDELLSSFESDPTRAFWIRFDERADLSGANDIEDWNERGWFVHRQLSASADASQRPVRAMLEARGVDHQAYAISNAIYVRDGTEQLARDVAALAAVQEVRAPTGYALVEPVERVATSGFAPATVEWGLANINADDVWSQFGATGAGITVASIDTGTQFDHPALVGAYRGNRGDGTFEHDYNWFDAAGSCAGAPCDQNGHGTHTMGTMVGDDGAGNQIGVAPGADWITANGCCPNDQALIASGEWLLAPRDLAGNDPDPARRPHIINNSWGSQVPSTDPFMEDVLIAWAAAGMFAVFANGNTGSACETSGSPGSRTVTYSVGAYDITNTIGSFSARGPGQDGTVKPDLAAPGVDIRSSVPGNGYASFQGTSMAAPHVGGAVALLWSAAPALIGDVGETRALLDETAVDADDPQCGGTADDNNVYGEGRLDALALLQAAPVGDAGWLAGTVTDALTGDPVAGARVSIAGAVDRTLTTGPDGGFRAALPVGEYAVTASGFGYLDQTRPATVRVGMTSTVDIELEPAPRVTVSGRVRDGSGHGWPLYAKVAVAGVPVDPVYTDPMTGRYAIEVPAGPSYQLTIEARTPGYRSHTVEVAAIGGDVTRDVALPVDEQTCAAAGYQFRSGVGASFDDLRLPGGWSVVDHEDEGELWRVDNPLRRVNETGGGGGFAIIDYLVYGFPGSRDTSLVTPVMDLSEVAEPVIGYRTDYFWQPSDTVVDVELSLDGGATWASVEHLSGDTRGARSIPVPEAAGEPQVQVRWHWATATFGTWWQVDDVQIGEPECVPDDGGLVVGHVLDQNTGAGVNGAVVRDDARPDRTTTTMDTSGDGARPDGFFNLFVPETGVQRFTAGKAGYTGTQGRAVVIPDRVTGAELRLPAGRLALVPATIDADVELGGSATRTVTVTNTGSAPARLDLGELPAGFDLLGGGAPAREVAGEVSVGSAVAATGQPTSEPDHGPDAAPWTAIPDFPMKIMDNSADVFDGRVYSVGGSDGTRTTAAGAYYDPDTGDWTRIADLPAPRQAPHAGFIGGKLYVAGGWTGSGVPSPSTFAYDPAGDTWTQLADAPVAVAAAGKAVLDGELYLVGGCPDSGCFATSRAVVRFDPDSGEWQRLADYPEPAAHLGCGAIDAVLYCTGGIDDFSTVRTSTYAYDPTTDTWTPRARLPIPNWGFAAAAAGGQLLVSGGVTLGQGGFVVHNRGFRYDPAANAWTALPNANHVAYRFAGACGFYKVGGALAGTAAQPAVEVLPGFDACGDPSDLPWLSVQPATASLEPGESVDVTITLDALVDQPGAYRAGIAVSEDTPYVVHPAGVTMHVTPPRSHGKIAGLVSGVGCDGTAVPLDGATVQIDWSGGRRLMLTGRDGTYGWWGDRRANPVRVTVAKDGYVPQTRIVRLRARDIVTADFQLPSREC